MDFIDLIIIIVMKLNTEIKVLVNFSTLCACEIRFATANSNTDSINLALCTFRVQNWLHSWSSDGTAATAAAVEQRPVNKFPVIKC